MEHRRNVIISLPADAMVMLIGPSGAGKSTFAAGHFLPTEVLSSDAMRALVADDPHDQGATDAAFELLHAALTLRLARRRLTVVDATNVEHWARQQPLAIARRARRPAVAIVFDLPLEECLAHNAARAAPRPAAAIRRQHRWLRDSMGFLSGEGFASAWTLASEDEVSQAQVVRVGAA
ncbi:MAG TPA: AAA family ATPase [Candidatus Limnocylindria bacterium]